MVFTPLGETIMDLISGSGRANMLFLRSRIPPIWHGNGLELNNKTRYWIIYCMCITVDTSELLLMKDGMCMWWQKRGTCCYRSKQKTALPTSETTQMGSFGWSYVLIPPQRGSQRDCLRRQYKTQKSGIVQSPSFDIRWKIEMHASKREKVWMLLWCQRKLTCVWRIE